VVAGFVRAHGWGYVGAELETRVQLCGRLVVSVDGRRVEGELPGKQGRLLFAYLTLNRLRPLTRAEILQAIWPDGHDGGLAPLLSKIRRVVPLDGHRVNADWVDVEAAADALHRAESALAQGDPHRAWAPSQVAMFVSERLFLAGEECEWIETERHTLAGLRLRALEAYAEAALGVGGTELAAAVRVGRELVALEPFRESGYRILIEALESEGNGAEAILVYEQLRARLREELGISPSEKTQAAYRRLLR
jgi:SARP family transcriptional regulator, regulator of embCAB operon